MSDSIGAIDGARRLAQSAGVRALSERVLRVAGEDARSWLNGQVSNQVALTKPGDAVYTLVLDARGKIVSDAWVLDRGAALVLLVPAGELEALCEHFDKYIVMEDVELAPLDEVVLTVQGPRAVEVLERAGQRGFPCDRLGIGGRDVVVSAAEAQAAQRALVEAAEAIGGGAVDEDAWELARLRRGRPRFGRDFGRAHYPQEAGLKTLAVSFTKGCYLGQEVVCTLENRGQLSRRLVQLEGAKEVPAGAELSHDGKVVGQVTSSVLDPEQGTRALGYVKRAAAAPGAVVTTDRGDLVVTALAGEPAPGQEPGRVL